MRRDSAKNWREKKKKEASESFELQPMRVILQDVWINSSAPRKKTDRVRGGEVDVMELSESQLQRDWRNERLIMAL